MNIIKVASLLITTLLIVPIISYFFGTPLEETDLLALKTVLYINLAVIIYCFVVGELTDNKSQVDKLWSLIPIVYAWVISDFGNYSPRLILMSVLVTIWGLRLTYNFSRHGAFTIRFWEGTEDYRWQVLRSKPEFQAKWKWTLFNLLFISGYQNILILLFTLPILVALQFNNTPLGLIDYLASGLMLFFIAFETVADEQHWNFQSKKHYLIKNGEELTGDYKKGFLDKGLWAYSRHPNYFAEQSIWVSFYLFSVSASGQWINWSIAGCLLLIVLFQGSSDFSEEISTSKYPEYTDYQKRVSRFFPMKIKK
jgi:steroid 5-alpha reductase family enzyme